MSEHRVSHATLFDFIGECEDKLKTSPVLLVTIQDADTGKWGMSRLWRAWIGQVSKFMADSGVTMPLMIKANGEHYGKRPFNADDGHELFTSMLLGVDMDGKRLSWSRKAHDGMRPATKGERLHAMELLQVWATERAIALYMPRESEFNKLKQESEK